MTPRATCAGCRRVIDYDPVFESACGHERCPSMVWHGLCLMDWRESGRENLRSFQRFVQHLLERFERG